MFRDNVKGRRLSATGDYRVPEVGEWRTTARRAGDEHFSEARKSPNRPSAGARRISRFVLSRSWTAPEAQPAGLIDAFFDFPRYGSDVSRRGQSPARDPSVGVRRFQNDEVQNLIGRPPAT